MAFGLEGRETQEDAKRLPNRYAIPLGTLWWTFRRGFDVLMSAGEKFGGPTARGFN